MALNSKVLILIQVVEGTVQNFVNFPKRQDVV